MKKRYLWDTAKTIVSPKEQLINHFFQNVIE